MNEKSPFRQNTFFIKLQADLKNSKVFENGPKNLEKLKNLQKT